MRAAVLGFLLLVAGCASTPFDAHLASRDEPLRVCAQWYEALDREVDAADVRDAQYPRVRGFPYLRVSRFLSSLRGRAGESEAAMKAFSERLLELDLEARRFEIENLPQWDGPRAAALKRTADCGRLLREADLADPRARAALLEWAKVPDDYSLGLRTLGLYPLTKIPFANGVRDFEAGRRAVFADPPPRSGAQVLRFEPPASGMLSRAAVAGMLGLAQLDPLGVPLLSDRALELVAATYAPSFELAVAADYDRFGELRWRRGARAPQVEAAAPVVYVQPAYTRLGERLLLQLVYTMWFPERPRQSSFDLLAGHLDGLVWRVTLAPDGEPLLYDSMHPCGCYHQFFPTPRLEPRPAPDSREEWAFSPLSLPRVAEGERPLVRVSSAEHFIEAVSFVRGNASLVRYSLRPYDELRSLATLEGGRRSAFGPDGRVPGTERLERFFFWPMGIESAGAMRQWGRHATAFVGRRHFDEPDLIEKRFTLAP
jgi:hypothetical protein